MTFDIGQLAYLAPLLCVTLFAILLLVCEAFAGGERRGYLMVLGVVGCGLALALSLAVWARVGPEAGGPRTIFSGMIVVDRFSLFFNFVFLLGAGLTLLLSPAFLREHGCEHGEYYSLVLFAVAGMMMVSSAVDLAMLFVGVETMSLAIYVLCGSQSGSARSSEAALKYFLIGAFASAILLYGIALLYGATGETGFRMIGSKVQRLGGEPIFYLGMFMLIVALGFKVAAVPFHMWTPDVYDGAPTPVTAFMSAAVKAAGFAAVLRLFAAAFGRSEVTYGSLGWASILSVLAVLTMTLGNIAALRQENVKRLLAYSSIAHAGYLLLGVVAAGLGVTDARPAVLYYLLAYTFTTIGSFGLVAWIGRKGDERLLISDWAGLSGRHPGAAIGMTLFLLSLAGIPPTAGFFGKFYLFRAVMERDQLVPLVVVAVLNSLVSVYYYLKIVTAMYFREPSRETAPIRGGALIAALIIAAFFVLQMGILPGQYLAYAASSLLGG